MESIIKPLRRSKQLAPLSREHHDGLLFVWKVRQGLHNNTAIEILSHFCIWYWNQHIKSHFQQEENILLQYINPDHKLVIQLKREHNDIRELILSIDHNPDRVTIGILADFIDRHIRFEERILFKHLEKTLSQEQLDAIFQQLENEPIFSGSWEDAFWKNDAQPINRS